MEHIIPERSRQSKPQAPEEVPFGVPSTLTERNITGEAKLAGIVHRHIAIQTKQAFLAGEAPGLICYVYW
jgi:hypothetical protein